MTLDTAAPQMVSLLGNSYSAGGGQLSQNHFQTGNNHLALLNELSRDHASFDINDFPQLTGQPNSASGSQGQLGKFIKFSFAPLPLLCNVQLQNVLSDVQD